MLELFILMLERVGMIILLAFLLVNVPFFKRILKDHRSPSAKAVLIVSFGAFAILSNFTGIEISGHEIIQNSYLFVLSKSSAIANARTLVIGVSGLIGGPLVGGTVGLIAGIHRLIQAGGAGAFYIPSSIIVGLLSGYAANIIKKMDMKNTFRPFYFSLIGMLMEFIQMVFVAVFSGSDLRSGIELVEFIAIPMILINGIGTFIFMSIILTTLDREEQMKAVQTHDVLRLAALTLPYFRAGLDPDSCQKVAKIILKYTKVAAISITDHKQILAHAGAGDDHHVPTKDVLTDLSHKVLRDGKMAIATSKEMIGCPCETCPLKAAIVIPLVSMGEVVGTLKLYFKAVEEVTYVEEELAEGLAQIFSSQIELGRAEEQTMLLQDAEIKSLQAQVNPHFFFNAVNTISALIRVDGEAARKLLIELSNYFRSNLLGHREYEISVDQELKQVRAYLSLEQARFADRYQVDYQIADDAATCLIPPFSIQVLVENAVKHAFAGRRRDNQILIKVVTVGAKVQLTVSDNGNGVETSLLDQLGKTAVTSATGSGTALENLGRRLQSLYGDEGEMTVQNQPNGGAAFTITLPRQMKEDEYERIDR